MYPAFKNCLQTICTLLGDKEKQFIKIQEGVRKCAERVFGLLFKRFKILDEQFRLWFTEDMRDGIKAVFFTWFWNTVAVSMPVIESEDEGSKGWKESRVGNRLRWV